MLFSYKRKPQLVGLLNPSVIDGAVRLTMQNAASAEGGRYRQPTDVHECFVILKEGEEQPIAKVFNEVQASELVKTLNDLVAGMSHLRRELATALRESRPNPAGTVHMRTAAQKMRDADRYVPSDHIQPDPH